MKVASFVGYYVEVHDTEEKIIKRIQIPAIVIAQAGEKWLLFFPRRQMRIIASEKEFATDMKIEYEGINIPASSIPETQAIEIKKEIEREEAGNILENNRKIILATRKILQEIAEEINRETKLKNKNAQEIEKIKIGSLEIRVPKTNLQKIKIPQIT